MFNLVVDQELELVLLNDSHIEELYRLIDTNRGHLRNWLPWVDETSSMAEVETFIEMGRSQYVSNNGFQAGIIYQGRLVGIIGYHAINWRNRSTTIGYWLAEALQGKGIMKRATKFMVDYAIYHLRLHRVEIRCAEANSRSRAIPTALGFKEEGLIRDAEWLYDHFVSHVVYGVLSEEWYARGVGGIDIDGERLL